MATRKASVEQSTEAEPIKTDDAVLKESADATEPEAEIKEEVKAEFIPIDESQNYCSNCQDRLHFDYIANKPVCPITHPDCPRNGV